MGRIPSELLRTNDWPVALLSQSGLAICCLRNHLLAAAVSTGEVPLKLVSGWGPAIRRSRVSISTSVALLSLKGTGPRPSSSCRPERLTDASPFQRPRPSLTQRSTPNVTDADGNTATDPDSGTVAPLCLYPVTAALPCTWPQLPCCARHLAACCLLRLRGRESHTAQRPPW